MKKTASKKPSETLKHEIGLPRRIFYIEKLSMRLYRLMELTFQGTEIDSFRIVAEDLPQLIYAKYLREIKNQAFEK